MPRFLKVIEVQCRNCGYHWETDPLKWRNMQFVNRQGREVKILRCPACNSAIALSIEQVMKILRAKKEMLKLAHMDNISAKGV